MSTSLVDDLKRDIAEGRVTVVVGAGVSMAATYDPARKPNVAAWTGLLESGADECVKVAQPLPKGWEERVRGEIASGDLDDLLSAAEKISRRLGAPDGGAYGKWLRETVGALKIRHPDVPAALGDLGLPLLTTNYDGILEDATRRPPLTWRDGGLVERVIRGEDASIVHLHGHWMRPDTVILGIRSYEEVLRDPHAQAMLRALRAMKSLLFVGVGGGLEDPNFGALLRWSREALAGSHYQHYRLELEQDVEARQKLHTREERLLVVSYGKAFGDLAPFLRSLLPPGKAAGKVVATPVEPGEAPRPKVLVAGPWFGVPGHVRAEIEGIQANEPAGQAVWSIRRKLLREDVRQAQIAAIARYDVILDASPWRAFERWHSLGLHDATLGETKDATPVWLALFEEPQDGEAADLGRRVEALRERWPWVFARVAAEASRGLAVAGFGGDPEAVGEIVGLWRGRAAAGGWRGQRGTALAEREGGEAAGRASRGADHSGLSPGAQGGGGAGTASWGG